MGSIHAPNDLNHAKLECAVTFIKHLASVIS